MMKPTDLMIKKGVLAAQWPRDNPATGNHSMVPTNPTASHPIQPPNADASDSNGDGGDLDPDDDHDFEIVRSAALPSAATAAQSVRFTLPQLKRLVQLASRLALERGIDAQDFRCAGCPTSLGLGADSAAL